MIRGLTIPVKRLGAIALLALLSAFAISARNQYETTRPSDIQLVRGWSVALPDEIRIDGIWIDTADRALLWSIEANAIVIVSPFGTRMLHLDLPAPTSIRLRADTVFVYDFAEGQHKLFALDGQYIGSISGVVGAIEGHYHGDSILLRTRRSNLLLYTRIDDHSQTRTLGPSPFSGAHTISVAGSTVMIGEQRYPFRVRSIPLDDENKGSTDWDMSSGFASDGPALEDIVALAPLLHGNGRMIRSLFDRRSGRWHFAVSTSHDGGATIYDAPFPIAFVAQAEADALFGIDYEIGRRFSSWEVRFAF